MHINVEEWMIYRFIVADVVGIISWLLLSAAYLTQRILSITLSKNNNNANTSLIYKIFRPRIAIYIISFALLFGTSLYFNSLVQRITTGLTYEHWSRFVAMSFFYSTGFIFITTLIIDYVLELINERLIYLQSQNINSSL